MVAWHDRKAWSDRFIPAIKRIVGEHLIGVADRDEDALHNTDLITLALPSDMRIACRVRRYEYLAKYADEFTLRCSVPSGRDTEIDKLLAGWGDYLFYGFADREESGLAAWLIGDLHVFRRWVDWHRTMFRSWPGELKRNLDGSSDFMVFAVEDVAPEFVIARQTGAPETYGIEQLN